MSYREQQFTAGQPLASQKLNQIAENDSLTRRMHYGADPPGELTDNVWWLDTSASPYVLKVYTGSEWLNIAKAIPDTIAWSLNSDHVTDSDHPAISDTAFVVTTQIALSTWESVGPTGSVADNIWTALDSLPETADWVRLRLDIFANTTGVRTQVFLWGRKTGSSLSAATSLQLVNLRLDMPQATLVQIEKTTEVIVPVDENNRFDLRHADLASNHTIDAYLVAWGTNA